MVNLADQDHFSASTRQGSIYDKEGPKYSYFMPPQAPQMAPVVIHMPDPAFERLRPLEEKFKEIEVHYTPGLDVVDMCLVTCLIIPQKIKLPYFKNYKRGKLSPDSPKSLLS